MSLSRKDDVGQREGQGAEDNDDDCGRRGHVVVVIEGRRKRLGGKGGRGTTDDGERGARYRFVVVFDLDPGSVKPPLPRA